VSQLEQRMREAARLGYRRLLTPPMRGSGPKIAGVESIAASTFFTAIEHLG
jgi:predicted ATP-dependent serine protease